MSAHKNKIKIITPIEQFGDRSLLVRGWHDPHVFDDGLRYYLNCQDAEVMSERFFKEYLSTHHKVNISCQQTVPMKRGQCRIGRILPGNKALLENKRGQLFRIEFHDGDNLVRFRFLMSPFCRGVALREIFLVIENILKKRYVQPEEWNFSDILSWDILSPEDIHQESIKKETLAYSVQEIERIRMRFPQWFQRKYKKCVCWGKCIVDGNYLTVTLQCPLTEDVRTFTGRGFMEREAKGDAIMQAVREFEFFKYRN